ncbi:hypothetical protein YC2023_076802 [Brassica napus]
MDFSSKEKGKRNCGCTTKFNTQDRRNANFLIATEAKAPRSKPPLRLRLQFHHRTTTLFSSPSYVLIPTGGRSQSSLCAQTVRPLKRSVLKLMSSSFLVYCSAMITLGKDKAV